MEARKQGELAHAHPAVPHGRRDSYTVDPDADPGGFFVRLADGADSARIVDRLQEELDDGALVVPNEPGESSEIDAFRTALLLVTALVLVVAFTNLFSTVLLTTRERLHDLGVLRAVGFTPRQIVRVTATGAALIGAVAAGAGIPLGLAVLGQLLDAIGEDTGMGAGFGVDPPAMLLVALVPLGAALAGALGALVARRPATAPVSELVRFE